jgi:hypothetical protein
VRRVMSVEAIWAATTIPKEKGRKAKPDLSGE